MPRLLWIDLRAENSHCSLFAAVAAAYESGKVTDAGRVCDAIEEERPDVLCFDYDYPGVPELRALQQAKGRYPRLPIVMLTEYHSEALAVWAFRSRVWDYLVQPVAFGDLRERLDALFKLRASAPSEPPRAAYVPVQPIPGDVRFHDAVVEWRALRPALRYVEANYSGKVALDEVARLCGFSKFHFSRRFRRELGVTFQEFVIRCRVDKARELLRNPRASVSEVAFAVGFEEPSYFSKIFRRHAGSSPSEYRRMCVGPGRPAQDPHTPPQHSANAHG
jgi:AraC-like DNA-binding protein/CheY-like chemotaxis protein